MILTPQNIKDLNAHAIREFPKESCGLIVDGDYMPCFNYASKPEEDFSISGAVQSSLIIAGKKIEAVVHSHPNGPYFPSQLDMQGQIDTALPWVLVATDGALVSPPEIWGADTPVPAILGRTFMHGIRDCYSLARDVFKLGKVELAKQGVEWPFDPIVIHEYPRKDGWWGSHKKPDQDLYAENFMKEGFVRIQREEARPGDGFLMKIHSERLNHAGLLLTGGLLVHHLPTRLSRREPAGIWARAADIWVRYEGNNA